MILFVAETLRFKSSSVVKVHKLGALVAHFKGLRTHAITVTRDIAAQLTKMAGVAATAESRAEFVSSCDSVAGIEHDFVLNVATKVTDARKKMLEGLGKGMAKVCTTYDTA